MAVTSPDHAKVASMTNGTAHRAVPPLENGDRLTRAEFERRYEAMPGVKKAELIEGVVYMPSPVRHRGHSEPHSQIVGWMLIYTEKTPGVKPGDNGTIRLDLDNEPQPDAYLMIAPDCGGQCRISEDDYLEGAPELIAEVASSSASYDLGDKRKAYRRNGVREYLVWRVLERRIDWFELRDEQFVAMVSEDGILRSRVFPGLWLDAAALLNGDLPKAFDALGLGLASEEHRAFVERLEQARGG